MQVSATTGAGEGGAVQAGGVTPVGPGIQTPLTQYACATACDMNE